MISSDSEVYKASYSLYAIEISYLFSRCCAVCSTAVNVDLDSVASCLSLLRRALSLRHSSYIVSFLVPSIRSSMFCIVSAMALASSKNAL